MVCLSNEGIIQATVKDTIDLSVKRHFPVQLSPNKSVESLFVEVGAHFNYESDSFELILQNQHGDTTVLNKHKHQTFADIKDLDLSGRITIILVALKKKNISLTVNESADDDLLLGASASPTMGDIPAISAEPTPMNLMSVELYCPRNQLSRFESCNYVGLVNQAMTCYLNSLLQALFMTPEFRNALYKWEFDGQNQEKSIPFQLQKLFLNLQTSTKSAVETTDLTHSFGWDMQEAWEQHDIQELCRVMFDALEQTFKDTNQANLINDLYEGKMIDYVKCLECCTEKYREDTFLDIPLPVRPFGSNVAYNSVEEALRAFVQPETLDGNNQYFCEKCNKKCDAHKGLKFAKFPYLLTLHLKRFDFDYLTMHRIKLNDKVVFPEVLNLNSFVPPQKNVVDEMVDDRENIVKCDDCSTTDSGSALDDESCQGTDVSSTVNGQDENCQDDDEGIDVSSGNHHENDKNRLLQEPKGPYIYELFSIMIHSGSASGGHYYAYIKDFKKNQWFCFNDQSVSRITQDDIQKTYGGGPQRVYYSGAYTSSTNAYMLMYRQKDDERNCDAMSVEEFPPHIQNLLRQMREKEESDRLAKEKENDMFKLKVYCHMPVTNQLKDVKVFPFHDNTLAETASEVYEKLDLKGNVSLEDCRLVTYNKMQDCIECSFDRDDYKFCDMSVKDYVHHSDWYLEIREPGVPFETYKPGGVKMKVYIVNIDSEEVHGPLNVRINPGETVREVKTRLVNLFLSIFKAEVDNLKLILEVYNNESTHLDEDDVPIKFDPNCNGYKLYVSSVVEKDDNDKHYIISRMHKVIDRFVHIINIDIILPDNDLSTLESLSIPPLDVNQNLDRIEMGSGDRVTNSPSLRVSPQPNNLGMEGFGDQSNSEDSSLSDSDRTLVGDAPGDCLGILSSSSNSPADQHMASPSDPAEDTYNDEVFGNPTEEMNWDDEIVQSPNYYFKVIMTQNKESIADQDSSRICQIMVDKRMTIGKLKKHLEIVVGVPTQYFKIYHQYPNQDTELTDMSKDLNMMKDGEKLLVKLGRVLKKNEMSGKIYLLKPDNTEPFTYLFDYIIARGQTVSSAKKDILLQAKKQHFLDINYNKCRLRKKNWKNPSKVYLDHQRFSEDIPIGSKFEMILQDLGEDEKMTKTTQMAVFVKRWCPATLTLTPFHEIVLDNPCMDELKRKLSEESGIPENYLDVAFIKSYFPCDMSILDVQKLDWNSSIGQFDTYSLHGREDGGVFFYRDSREPMKELTSEEEKEISQKENTRLGRYNTKTFSPNRRERGLKIYLDTLPKKTTDDTVVD